MPYIVSKVKGGYRVTSPHGVKAKRSTKANAMAQLRFLKGLEHGMKPRK